MQDPLASFRIVRVNDISPDPAVDTHAMLNTQADHVLPNGDVPSKFIAYITTRDERHLVLREGATPTWFVVQRMPPIWVARNLDSAYADPNMRDERAFRIGCHEVQLPGGEILRPPTPPTGKPLSASDDWSELIADRFGMFTVYESGRVAHDRATLPVGQRGPFSYPRG